MPLQRLDSAAVGHADFIPTLTLVFLAAISPFVVGTTSAKKGFVTNAKIPGYFSALGKPASGTAQRRKLAEGEYAVFASTSEGGVGPFDPQVFGFHESWMLWSSGDGGYEVDGERKFESPKDKFHRDRFWVRLTRDWRLVAIKEFAKLRWRRDSGPLVCDIGIAALHCTSGAKDPSQLVKLDVNLDHPFAFLWPISPFSLSSVAKAEERRPHKVMPVELITIEEPSPKVPVSPMIVDGRLRYLGKADVTLADRKWQAEQFELEAVLHPKFRIMTAPEGFLLDLIVESPAAGSPSAEMKLVRFRQWADFPSHPGQ